VSCSELQCIAVCSSMLPTRPEPSGPHENSQNLISSIEFSSGVLD